MRHSDCITAINHGKYDQLRTGSADQGAEECKNHEIRTRNMDAHGISINGCQRKQRSCGRSLKIVSLWVDQPKNSANRIVSSAAQLKPIALPAMRTQRDIVKITGIVAKKSLCTSDELSHRAPRFETGACCTSPEEKRVRALLRMLMVSKLSIAAKGNDDC